MASLRKEEGEGLAATDTSWDREVGTAAADPAAPSPAASRSSLFSGEPASCCSGRNR